MIQVLNRAFDILEYIAQTEGEPQRLKDIAARFELHEATCANILKTLIARDYVDQVAPRGGYVLGPMAFYLPKDRYYRPGLVMTARPFIDDLASSLNEACLLITLHNNRRYVLYQVESQQDIVIKTEHFLRKSFYESATGRLLLAYIDETQLDRFLELHGYPTDEWRDAQDALALSERLQEIREIEYCSVITQTGIAGLAVPIWSNGLVIASLSSYMPLIRYGDAERTQLLASLRFTAEEISAAHNARLSHAK